MTEYHVGCGIAGIYAGIMKGKSKNEWKDKTLCTDEAIAAVSEWMVQNLLGGYDCKKAENGAYVYKLKDGRKLELSVTIK